MSIFYNMRIAAKLITCFIIVALIAVFIGYTGFNSMSEMKKCEDQVSKVRLPSVQTLLIISEAQTAIDSAENALVNKELSAQNRSDQYDRIENAWNRVEEAWDIYAPLPQTVEEKVLWDKFVPAWNEWKADHQEFISLAIEFDQKKSERVYKQMINQAFVINGLSFKTSENLLNQLVKINTDVAAQTSINFDDNYKKAARNQLIIIVVGFLISIALGVYLSSIISKPMKELTQAAEKIALGDVNVAVKSTTTDEIGILMQSFSNMVDNIKQQAEVAERIAAGDISVHVLPKSEDDVLAKSMNEVVKSLRELVAESEELTKAAVKGELNARGNEDSLNGGYKEIVSGVNRTLDAIVTPVNEALESLRGMSGGDLSSRMVGDYQGDFAVIKDSVNTTGEEIQGYIAEMSNVLSEMSNSNLDVEISREYLGDFSEMKDSINGIIDSFNAITLELRNSADQVEVGAQEVSNSSQVLSQGATEQAGSVEEISATIAQVTEQTKLNAINANRGNEIAIKAKSNAEQGNEQMKEMLIAMNGINDSSNKISKIIKVIDDIAFQTNILALNAAVEAARAGEHGKGFAVVAEEVRSLAARSAEAAKETTDMIDDSIKRVNDGTNIANETAKALRNIVNDIAEVGEIIEDIANASNEQSTAIVQINDGIMQISEVTQSNTATAEESASASEEMASQANVLKNLVGAIRIKESGGTVVEKRSVGVIKTVPQENDKTELEIVLDDKEFGKY